MSGHTDKHRLFFVWVCSFRMWRGPAGYQCLHSRHKVRKCERHATEADLIWFLPNLLHVCPAALQTWEGMMAEKQNLKIGWKKSKEHTTEFLEIMRFSILWVTSLSGNPVLKFTQDKFTTRTLREEGKRAYQKERLVPEAAPGYQQWGLFLHDCV